MAWRARDMPVLYGMLYGIYKRSMKWVLGLEFLTYIETALANFDLKIAGAAQTVCALDWTGLDWTKYTTQWGISLPGLKKNVRVFSVKELQKSPQPAGLPETGLVLCRETPSSS